MFLAFFVAGTGIFSLAHAAPDNTDAFLQRHWVKPVPLQGKAPSSYSSLEASLQPSDCGACHAQQYQEWRTSLHAHAMGPGIMGQLLDLDPDATTEIRACTICHAPLAEQEASLKKSLRGAKQSNALHEQGLVCASCHVRQNVRYGPPSRKPASAGPQPHDGFVADPAFEDGRFCATCHQFGKDGYAVNGKPLENTYAEWQASPYASQGKQCQACHMPDRKHLWRGIHDADMTRSGVTIRPAMPTQKGGKIFANLTLTNSGTGHAFPTYVTPRVIVRIYQESADKHIIKGTVREKIIGRLLSADMSEELADTRLTPGEGMELSYKVLRQPEAKTLVYRVIVEPDYLYSGIFQSILDGEETDMGTPAIQQALNHSLKSAYDLFIKNYVLD